MDTVRVSAIICTHNRDQYLRRALQSLVQQSLSTARYEVLVIDNGSTDNTRSVVTEFESEPNVRYIYEPVLGLSQARNTGLREAQGEFVAYLDDDAVACSGWLEYILAAFVTVKPQPGCAGGRIDPVWEAPRPPWLSDRLLRYLAVVNWTDEACTLNESQWLAGANIAFVKNLLRDIGGFPTELGRKGKSLVSMEETVLQDKISQLGYSCFYDPEICVEHYLQPERLTEEWFRRRAYWQGASQAAVYLLEEQPSIPKRLMRLTVALGGLLARPRGLLSLTRHADDPQRFDLQFGTLTRIGYISYLSGAAG